MLTRRLITVRPQRRSAALRGDDVATVMMSHKKRRLQSPSGAAGALEVPLPMEGGVHTAMPVANDGRRSVENVGAATAVVDKRGGVVVNCIRDALIAAF